MASSLQWDKDPDWSLCHLVLNICRSPPKESWPNSSVIFIWEGKQTSSSSSTVHSPKCTQKLSLDGPVQNWEPKIHSRSPMWASWTQLRHSYSPAASQTHKRGSYTETDDLELEPNTLMWDVFNVVLYLASNVLNKDWNPPFPSGISLHSSHVLVSTILSSMLSYSSSLLLHSSYMCKTPTSPRASNTNKHTLWLVQAGQAGRVQAGPRSPSLTFWDKASASVPDTRAFQGPPSPALSRANDWQSPPFKARNEAAYNSHVPCSSLENFSLSGSLYKV